MKKRPSNTLMAVVLGVLALFGIYVIGTLVLEARQDVRDEEEIGRINDGDRLQQSQQ